MKKWSFAILLIPAFGLFLFFHYRASPTPHTKKTQETYFVPIPVSRYSNSQQPCITFEIEGQKISGILDLGFKGYVSMTSEELNRLQDKTFVKSRKMYNFRGAQFEEKVYAVSPIHIGSLRFSNVGVQEEALEFQKSSKLVSEEPPLFEQARLGWQLFPKSNLLLDFKNERIAFSDSLETLQKQNLFSGKFFKIPFETHRGLIEVIGTLDQKPLRFVIDTGSTYNLIHDSPKSDFIEYPSFILGEEDEGPIEFYPLALNFPFPVDGILGMQFLREHLIFLDFAERQIYIAKY